MKKLFLIISILTSLLISGEIFAAEELKGNLSFSNYEQASVASSQLKFTVVSTKVGLFSSEVDGYVKAFSYRSGYDSQNKILRDMTISFDPKMMDTDGESRDEKLHAKCMEADKYPTLKVVIKGPAFLKDMRERTYAAKVYIRGKEKDAQVKMKTSYDENTGEIKVMGESTWSLQQMEIPDPSIAVAKLSDEIVIRFQLMIKE